ncbi:hypothetical protein AB8Q18_02075 [Neisseriaceae bacterium CLB008]|nr:hypothetical protein [Neisseriaceae bacterium]
MTKPLLKWLPAVAVMAVLTGCAAPGTAADADQGKDAAPKEVAVDTTKDVTYACGQQGDQKLAVKYGFKGQEAVAAVVTYQDQTTPVLLRDPKQEGNVFQGSGITWASGAATLANVASVDGNMLMQEGTQEEGGKSTEVSNIITKYCKVVAS